MLQNLFPFVFALLLVLLQPVFDMVCETALDRNQFSDRSVVAARWAAATSAFPPAAVLTVYGALDVMVDEGENSGWVLIGALILVVVCFCLFLYTGLRGGPSQSWRTGPGAFKYTFLQVVLAVLNVVGIGLVISYHVHGTPLEAPGT